MPFVPMLWPIYWRSLNSCPTQHGNEMSCMRFLRRNKRFHWFCTDQKWSGSIQSCRDLEWILRAAQNSLLPWSTSSGQFHILWFWRNISCRSLDTRLPSRPLIQVLGSSSSYNPRVFQTWFDATSGIADWMDLHILLCWLWRSHCKYCNRIHFGNQVKSIDSIRLQNSPDFLVLCRMSKQSKSCKTTVLLALASC